MNPGYLSPAAMAQAGWRAATAANAG